MSFLGRITLLVLAFMLTAATVPASAQQFGPEDVRHAFYLEFLGYSAGISINYEQSNSQGHAFRLGVGFPLLKSAMIDDNYGDCEQAEIFFIGDGRSKTASDCSPVLHIGYYYSKPFSVQEYQSWAYEFGAGPSVYLVDAELRGFITLNFGIRVVGTNFGILRAGFTPSFGQGLIITQFGLSAGLWFKPD
ncbi:hypothetical protein CYPRO_3055 [Cyclonatronum proteinivorum]|uniref:Outer membrane protein beta-barrel domain-containing protein n=1 Tax=Cyclonatronum proteinivorum TaxID=1457365 RepID=A0A345UP89_9BACT|nr:hypothetical protein [Cyclonatronum proteinivorum]AXJ02291.1 hypothetical protein CYPRO_3055 [Cyclonatronum proteinivorum]